MIKSLQMYLEPFLKHFHDGALCQRLSFWADNGSFWKKKGNAFWTFGLDGSKHVDINVEVSGNVYNRAISCGIICNGRSYLLFRICSRTSRSKMEDLVRTGCE